MKQRCLHSWTIADLPKRRWRRRRWCVFCHLCGTRYGSWLAKADAFAFMSNENGARP